MRLSATKVIVTIAGVILVCLAAVILYFYIGLSGNPITGWSEKHDCIRHYEQTYGKDFVAYSSNYDYKRRLFEFDIGPADRPEIRIQTTVGDLKTNDGYGTRLAEYSLEQAASRILEQSYGNLNFTINACEANNPSGITETDPDKRLIQNNYSVHVSWKDDAILKESADALVSSIAEAIYTELKGKAKAIDFHARIQRATSDFWFYNIPSTDN